MIRALIQEPRLRDVRNFTALAWRHLNLPEPTPLQFEIVDWMSNGPRRLVVKGFRGIGKSWLASVYACHQWALDPSIKILVVSGGARRAGDFSTFTRQLLESWDLLAELRPQLDALRDSKISFDVASTDIAHAASMTSLGITGQLTGSRADVIIADDVETMSNSDTPGKRERIASYFREFGSILSPGGRIRVLGTDQTEESLYRALPAMGYEVRCWPAQVPDGGLKAALGETLAPSIRGREDEGAATDPERFPLDELLAKESELGRSHFRLQFSLDPRLADMDRYPLRLSDLIVTDLDNESAPENLSYGGFPADVPCIGFSGDRYLTPVRVSERWLPYQGKVLAVDPAGRGKDETAACVLGQLNGFLFLLEQRAWLGEGYSDECLAALADMASRHRVAAVVVEANFGDGMFGRLLEPHLHRAGHHCLVEEVRNQTQKERRIIDTLEPIIQQHRLVVNRSVLMNDLRPVPGLPEQHQQPYRLAYQLSRITRDRGSLQRDDRLDALAIGAAWWKDAMAQDAQRRVQQEDGRRILQEMEEFRKHAVSPMRPREAPKGWLGKATGRPSPPGWRQQSRRPDGRSARRGTV